ncbi:unnamed protein product [Ectocarpus sp. 12 AP-2014]
MEFQRREKAPLQGGIALSQVVASRRGVPPRARPSFAPLAATPAGLQAVPATKTPCITVTHAYDSCNPPTQSRSKLCDVLQKLDRDTLAQKHVIIDYCHQCPPPTAPQGSTFCQALAVSGLKKCS